MPERHLGRTLGRYRVDELVGSGGFAWVYKGYDAELDIPVALKVLKPQFAGDEAFEERFRREASTAAKLRHPNIIKIYAVGREGDAVYFAMDYLPNGLADRLEVTNVLPEELVIRVGMDVASALGFAHREGVIHRDIKVDNILFDAHGNAVVCDFGIARAVSGYIKNTGTNMVVGTPQYFAPEQARARPLDGRADIYSLGVTMYRAATGQLPFGGEDWYEIARQHVEEPPPAPRSVNPGLSVDFERVILHCLEKSPDDRPATGETLCQELAVLLPTSLAISSHHARMTSNEPTVTIPSTPSAMPGIVAERERRSRVWVAGAVAVALIAASIPIIGRGKTKPSTDLVVTDSTFRLTPINALADSVQRRIDSAAARPESVARRDSVRKANTPRATAGLAITAPGARILIDDIEVGTDSYQSDTLKHGRHVVTAMVDAIPGCEEWSVAKKPVDVAQGRRTPVTLSPRPCGTFTIFATPSAGATFTIKSADDTQVKSGPVPGADAPIVLPVGRYRYQALAGPKCSPYNTDDIEIKAGLDTPLHYRHYCPP